MKSSIKFTTNNFIETQAFAVDFAKQLKGSTILCLYGDLGFGKTTFIQGLAKGLGVSGRIISPSFIIMRSYKLSIKYFYHVDLYRINHEQEIIDLGLLDIMNGQNNITAIEWPEKLGKFMPEKRIDIKLDYVDENKRNFNIFIRN